MAVKWVGGVLALVMLLAGCDRNMSQSTPSAAQMTTTPSATKELLPTHTAIATPTPTRTPTPQSGGVLPPDAEIAFIQTTIDGEEVWATNRDGSVTQQLVPIVDTSKIPSLHWSPDGQWLSVLLSTQLWLFERAGAPGQMIPYDLPMGRISRPTWSPDSSKIAFSQVMPDRTSTTLILRDVSTGQHVTYAANAFAAGMFSGNPVWSPDGTTIAMLQTSEKRQSSQTQSALVLLDVASGQVTFHIGEQPRTFSGTLHWSPDSQRLAVVAMSGITIFHVADLSFVTTTDCRTGDVNYATWSPDSQWVTYHRSNVGRYSHGFVCLTSVAGETIWIGARGNASNPVWRADSQSLFLAVTTLSVNAADIDAPPRPPDPRLVRFDLATRQLERVTALPQGTYGIVGWIWPSPDRQTIAIAYPRRDSILTLIDQNSTLTTTIALPISLSYTPQPFMAWSADARHIFFVTTVAGEDSNRPIGQIFRFDRQDRSLTTIVQMEKIEVWAVAPQIQPVSTSMPKPHPSASASRINTCTFVGTIPRRCLDYESVAPALRQHGCRIPESFSDRL